MQLQKQGQVWRKRTYDQYQIQEILEKRKLVRCGTIARSMGMNRGTVQKIMDGEQDAMVGFSNEE